MRALRGKDENARAEIDTCMDFCAKVANKGRHIPAQTEICPLLFPLSVKIAVSIAQNCSETQISFAFGQPSRQKRGVDRPKQ